MRSFQDKKKDEPESRLFAVVLIVLKIKPKKCETFVISHHIQNNLLHYYIFRFCNLYHLISVKCYTIYIFIYLSSVINISLQQAKIRSKSKILGSSYLLIKVTSLKPFQHFFYFCFKLMAFPFLLTRSKI